MRFAAVLLWMTLIFGMSAREADLSSEDSGRITIAIVHVICPGYDSLPDAEQHIWYQKTEHAVRKTAHMTEYGILAILILRWLAAAVGESAGLQREGEAPGKKRAWGNWVGLYSWIITVLYACTDEFHQRFVPGRSGEWKDVGFDAIGAAAGVLLAILFFKGKVGNCDTRGNISNVDTITILVHDNSGEEDTVTTSDPAKMQDLLQWLNSMEDAAVTENEGRLFHFDKLIIEGGGETCTVNVAGFYYFTVINGEEGQYHWIADPDTLTLENTKYSDSLMKDVWSFYKDWGGTMEDRQLTPE